MNKEQEIDMYSTLSDFSLIFEQHVCVPLSMEAELLLFIIVVRPTHVCKPPVALPILMEFHTLSKSTLVINLREYAKYVNKFFSHQNSYLRIGVRILCVVSHLFIRKILEYM